MLKNILHTLVTKGLVALINFFLLVISARYLGVSSRGEISIFVLNLAIVQAVNEIYTGYTLIYFVPRFDLKRLFVAGIVYTFLFCSLSNAVIVLLNRQVPGFEWLGYVIGLLVMLNTFNCVLILGKEMVRLYNLLSVLQPFLLLTGLGVCIALLKDVTFRAYVYPLLFSFCIALLVSGAAVLKFVFKNKMHRPFELKPVLTNGFFCQAGILMYMACNRYSYYLLADRAEVGLYASASSLTEAVLIIMNGISPVLMARVANEGNTLKSAGLALSLGKASFLLSTVCILFVVTIPEHIFVMVLGQGFAGIRHLMFLYAPAVVMVSFFGILSGYFSATGRLRVVLLANGAGFVVALVVTPLLVHRYHAQGAAGAAILAYAAIVITMSIAFFKITHLPFRRLFAFREDYENLRSLLKNKK